MKIWGIKMKNMLKSKRLGIRIFSIITLVLIGTVIFWYYLKPYNIEKWQIEINNTKWQLSNEVVTKLSDYTNSNPRYLVIPYLNYAIKLPYKLSFINNKRYRNALISKAVHDGMDKNEIVRLLNIADKQVSGEKLPILIKESIRNKVPIFIVIYRVGNGNPFGLWDVIIQRDNKKVIESEGTC